MVQKNRARKANNRRSSIRKCVYVCMGYTKILRVYTVRSRHRIKATGLLWLAGPWYTRACRANERGQSDHTARGWLTWIGIPISISILSSILSLSLSPFSPKIHSLHPYTHARLSLRAHSHTLTAASTLLPLSLSSSSFNFFFFFAVSARPSDRATIFPKFWLREFQRSDCKIYDLLTQSANFEA